jgi:hypothetical protein
MSTGIGKCLADVLRNDVTTLFASSYVAAYPLQFNAASAVPTYLYTCIKDIWLSGTPSSGYTNTQWAGMVTDSFGVGQSGSRTIDVQTNRIMDQCDSPVDIGPKSNATGAEFAEVFIYLKIGGTVSQADADRCALAELRIRSLIDYNWGTNVNGIPEIPVTDLTIDPQSDVKAYWDGLVGKDSKEFYVRFYCFYQRLVVKRLKY